VVIKKSKQNCQTEIFILPMLLSVKQEQKQEKKLRKIIEYNKRFCFLEDKLIFINNFLQTLK